METQAAERPGQTAGCGVWGAPGGRSRPSAATEKAFV